MEELKLTKQNEDDEELFCEAFEEFPFYECSESFYKSIESDADISSSSIITLDSECKLEKSSPADIQGWRYTSMDDDSTDYTRLSSSVSSEENYVSYRGEKFELFPDMKENEEENEISSPSIENPDGIKLNLSSESVKHNEIEENKVNSTINYANNVRIHDFLLDDTWSVRDTHDANSNSLTLLAGLTIKAIEFEFNLLISFFKFPMWLSNALFMFIKDPFRVMEQGREYLIGKAMGIWGSLFGDLSASVYEWFKEPQSVVELVLKFGWGLLWSVYVGAVLVAMLVSAFVVGAILMSSVLEEPIIMKEKLNFDYTGKSPVEFVPIIACPDACYGRDCSEKLEVAKLGGVRVIPPEHKLQVTVSLTLPESDYNRNLGMFQVRVDFLAADGKVLASSRHPSMLHFRSQPIRLLLTFLKVPPLLYGYTSETQDLNIKFSGFTEAAATPTACLRVIIEQRAEFQPGAGIPEMHSASLTLESEQPGLKRIIWNWRKTLLVWISMTIFKTELLLVLLCCNPILIPRVKLGQNSARNGTS